MMDNKVSYLDARKDDIKTEESQSYVSSELQADALFNFVDKIDYIIEPLEKRMLSPRYCFESVKYLEIDDITSIAFPMKCFCDISFHRLGKHLEWYGYYGLAFSKEWGLRSGIQPVQYINKDSVQRKDFTEVLNLARSATKSSDDVDNKLKSFILEQMLYYKPYDGEQSHGNRNEKKCFADECEWRYIPDVSKKGFVQVYYRATTQPEALERLNKAMNMDPDVSLKFEYDDIKYIVIKDKSDFDRLLKVIDGLKCDNEEKYKLFSKIIIWEKQRRDF